jgi:hypothetical protein
MTDDDSEVERMFRIILKRSQREAFWLQVIGCLFIGLALGVGIGCAIWGW